MDTNKTPTKPLSCILLVDDDEATNFLHSLIIKRSGIEAHTQVTYNGEEALEYLCSKGKYVENGPAFPQPGIIFLDINMPNMNGWEFLEAYHRLPPEQKADIVIAMLTTSLNPDDELKANEQAELSGYLKKPLTVEKVHALVNQYWPGTLTSTS
jgi:CheY-like chemotaxis protein